MAGRSQPGLVALRQWRRIIEAWGGTVGMNFDPSHLVWQGLDAERWIGEFGEHIYFFQAQDLHIDQDAYYEAGGAMSNGMGWQVRRLPGLGSVDWGLIFRSLYRPATKATASSSTRIAASKALTSC